MGMNVNECKLSHVPQIGNKEMLFVFLKMAGC